MTQFLDIHLASDEERRAAHVNCHDIWHLGLSVEDHVIRREKSALHRRARWIVGTLDGRVVAALASHPLRFRVHGRSYPGIGIASVHTLCEFRGQGIAQRLIHWIERFEHEQSAAISILFCDIEPKYYERLGYILCPSYLGWADCGDATLQRSEVAGYRLVAAGSAEDFAAQIPRFAALYDSDHGRRPLSIERSEDYWLHLAARQPTAERFWLVSDRNEECGYVWLRPKPDELIIEDHAVRDGDEGLRTALWSCSIAVGKSGGLARTGGWMPASSQAARLFQIAPRRDEIAMVKPLDQTLTIDPEAIAAADWLQEIDHV